MSDDDYPVVACRLQLVPTGDRRRFVVMATFSWALMSVYIERTAGRRNSKRKVPYRKLQWIEEASRPATTLGLGGQWQRRRR